MAIVTSAEVGVHHNMRARVVCKLLEDTPSVRIYAGHKTSWCGGPRVQRLGKNAVPSGGDGLRSSRREVPERHDHAL